MKFEMWETPCGPQAAAFTFAFEFEACSLWVGVGGGQSGTLFGNQPGPVFVGFALNKAITYFTHCTFISSSVLPYGVICRKPAFMPFS